MATISGSVMLRPARVGLLVAKPSLEDVQAAVVAATSSWGGLYFPIIDLDGSVDLDRELEAWSIDVLWPVTNDGRASVLADRAGFRWAGLSPYGPFDPPRDSLSTRVLDSAWVLDIPGLKVLLPPRPEGELAAFFSVWFGRFGPDEDGRTRHDLFASHAEQLDVRDGGSLVRLVEGATPIDVTGLEVTYQGDRPGTGVVLVDPSNPEDLLRFWNLRASGADVLPWPLDNDQLIEPLARRWIGSVAVSGKLPKLIRGDGTPLSPHLTIWSSAHHADRAGAVEALLRDFRLGALPGHEFVGGWTGVHPLTTDFSRSFNIEAGPRATGLAIPLPVLPWPSGRRRGYWPGIVAADVSLFGERGLTRENTPAVPRVRRLAKLLASGGSVLESFRRPNGEGGIYGIQAVEETVQIRLVPALDVLEGLFDQPGWRFSQSEDGQFTDRLADILRNSVTAAASQPAIREVLLQAARRNDAGAPFDALLQTAIRARGSWPDRLTGQTAREYGRNLLLWLLERKLLRMVLPVTCPSCRSALVLTPDELATEIRCGFCDDAFPLGLPVADAGPRSAWRYRIAGHVPEPRLRAALPVLAVSSVLATLSRGVNVQPQAMGAKITSADREAEFDIAAVVDAFSPAVVLSEIKSHNPIDENDIDNLTWAQNHLRDNKVECHILVTTLNSTFAVLRLAGRRDYFPAGGPA
jgi:LSD1 subclass zinc finger protein